MGLPSGGANRRETDKNSPVRARPGLPEPGER